MRTHPRRLPVLILSIAGCLSVIGLLIGAAVVFDLPMLQGQEPFPKPPEQQYIGAMKCAPCHLEQYRDWQGDKHSEAFAALKGDYQTDTECLKCHSTGHGAPSGYAGPEMDARAKLQGVTCEACHGPGSKHREVARELGDEPSEAEIARVKSSIHLLLPGNVCVTCHQQKAHNKHPEVEGMTIGGDN